MPKSGLKVGVIGAGPAGLAFSVRAAELDVGDITVFERFDDVDRSFCGEYISNNVPVDKSILSRCVRSRTKDIKIIFIDDDYTVLSEKTIFRDYVLIDSGCLKRELKAIAMDKGVKFHFNTTVMDIIREGDKFKLHVIEDGQDKYYYFDMIVGADGNNSIVRRKLLPDVKIRALPSIRKRYYIKNYEEGDFRFYLAGPFKFGYGWVYPGEVTERGILTNIGVGFISDYVHSSTTGLLEEFVSSLKSTGLEITPAEGDGIIGNMIPFSGIVKPGGGRRFILVGDALGTVNAVVGGGVGYALESGRIAPEYLVNHDDMDFSDWHDYVLKTEWGRSIEKSRRIIEIGEIIYKRNPDLFRHLARALNHVDDDLIYSISQGNVSKNELLKFVFSHPLLSLNIIVHLRPLKTLYELRSVEEKADHKIYTSGA